MMLKLMGLIIILVSSLGVGILLGQHKLPVHVTDFLALENLTLGRIYNLEFTPDSKHLIVSAGAGLYLYDADTFTRQSTISLKAIGDFDLSPDGKQIVYRDHDSLQILDTQTWKPVKRIEPTITTMGAVFTHATFAPDNVTIATASAICCQPITISIWTPALEGQTYQVRTLNLRAWGEYNITTSLEWTPDGTHLILRAGMLLTVIRVADLQIVYETSGVWRALLSPDGRRLLVTSYLPAVLLDTQTWQVQQSWEASVWEGFSSWNMVWNPVDEALVSHASTNEGLWSSFNLKTGDSQLISTLSTHADIWTEHILRWSPDGTTLVVVTNELETTITILDTSTWQIKHVQMTRMGNHQGNMAWSTDEMVIQTHEYLWNTHTFAPMLHFPMQQSNGSFLTGQVSPSGAYVATLTSETEIAIVDVKTGATIDRVEEPSFIQGISWSPDSRYLAIVPQETSSQIDFLTLADGQIVDRQSVSLPTHTQQVARVYWSPDGQYLYGGLEIFAVHEQNEKLQLDPLWQMQNGGYIPGSWSSDGQMLAVLEYDYNTYEYYLQLRNASDGNLLTSVLIPSSDEGYIDSFYTAAWSPSGTYLAFGHESGVIKIWLFIHTGDKVFFKQIRTLERHLRVSVGEGGSTAEVSGLRWITESKLHSIGADGVLRVWGITQKQ